MTGNTTHNTKLRCAFAHPLGPRYVPLLLVCPPRPLRTFASLNAHLQVHLGLGGKPRSGLRPHSLNRAASPCCGLRTFSGRFDALAVQRKAMRCPSAAPLPIQVDPPSKPVLPRPRQRAAAPVSQGPASRHRRVVVRTHRATVICRVYRPHRSSLR